MSDTRTLDDSPVASEEASAARSKNGDNGDHRNGGGGGDGRIVDDSKQSAEGADTAESKVAADSSRADEAPGNSSVTSPNGRWKRWLLIAAGVVLIAALVAVGVVPRLRRQREVEATTANLTGGSLQVSVARPRRAPENNELVLPGTAQAAQETTVSARTSGFVRRHLVDIGDRVRSGQVLAEIDTPELDQQLSQARQELDGAVQLLGEARAQLLQARAGVARAEATFGQSRTNSELARTTLDRSKFLAQRGLVSRQENDERQAQYDARVADSEVALANIKDSQANVVAQQAVISSREAGVRAQQANVRRLVELSSFKRVVAPFDGVITARNVDVGSLISSGGGVTGAGNMIDNGGAAAGDTNTADNGLFRLARIDAIRIYVSVPQTFVAAIFPGLEAEVSVRELADQKFGGKVVRTASNIDPATRTLLTEVLIGNESGKLLPGMFTQVRFTLAQQNAQTVLVPASALALRAEGTRVVVVRPDNTIHFQEVEVGRDYGKELEIVNGLNAEDRIVVNPTDGLSEGARVEAKEAPAEGQGNNQQQGASGQTGGSGGGNSGGQPPQERR